VAAMLLSAIAGALAVVLMHYLPGREVLIFVAVVGLGVTVFLSIVKFDFMVLVTFCLLGIVRIEPAPVDGLSMLLLLVGISTGKLSLKALKDSSLIHLALWTFLMVNIASLMGAKMFSDSLRFAMISVYLIAFTYFVKMYVTSFQAMRVVLVGYLVSAAVNTCLVVLGYRGISPFTELFLQDGARALGAFKDPNVFGPFCIPIIVWLVDESLHPHILPGFVSAKIIGVIALTAAVFVSFSRAAWANLALALCVYSLLNIKEGLRVRVSSLPKWGGSLLVLAAIGSQVFKPFFSRIDFEEFLAWRLSAHEYDVYRFDRQRAGVEAGLTHLFGVGPGMWESAHSLYARALAEHGVLGLAALSLFILTLLIGTCSQALQEITRPYGLSAKVVAACLAGLVLNSAVIDTIHWRHFWLVLALAWVIITQREPALPDQSFSLEGTVKTQSS
jgi:hypothetical protein